MTRQYQRLGFDKNTETHKWCASCEQLLKRESGYNKNKARHDGLDTYCKICYKEKRRQRLKTKEGRKKHNAASQKWIEKNKEKHLEYQREWRKNNRDKVNDYSRELNKEWMRNARKNPVFRLRNNVSRQIHWSLTREGGSKRGESVLKHLPYSQEQLKQHLESMFEDWMTWDNYGNGPDCWSLDHIIPQTALPYDSLDHPNFQKCWALENLRPLNHIENVKKSNKIIDVKQ